MGEKKRAEFGSAFASAIATFLETNPRMTFNE
jgi:ATP-dependent DNA helicase RecQ